MNESEIGIEGREPEEFERNLMRALRRVDAPADFAARLMNRAALPAKTPPRRPRLRTLWVRAWAGGAVAALPALGLLVATQAHLRHRRDLAVLSQRRFETALRVTDRALDQTRAQLERAGIKLGD